MAETQPEVKVDSEIVKMWRTDGWLYAIAGFLVGLMTFPLLASVDGGRLAGFLESLAPEAVSILVTVAFIDRLIRRRDAKNAEEALKRQLEMDAGSLSNEIAKNAVHQLRRKGWLVGENGLLKGADLYMANLHDANMETANLQDTNFTLANLQSAILLGANLEGANLQLADMQGAKMDEANLEDAHLLLANLHGAYLDRAVLQGVNLWQANLYRADLSGAELQGADLQDSNLQDADLRNALFDSSTLLPDGSQWTPETDMRRFTDPKHPDFWRSDWLK